METNRIKMNHMVHAVCNGPVSDCFQIELGSTCLLWLWPEEVGTPTYATVQRTVIQKQNSFKLLQEGLT